MKGPGAPGTKEQKAAAEHWEEGAQGVRLIASKCTSCGQYHLPAVPVCASCGAQRFERASLGSSGTVYAFTINHVPPPGYPTVFAVGYVDFPEGVRVFGQIRIPEDGIKIGDRVSLEKAVLKVTPDGADVVGYRFVPVRSA